VKGHNGLLFFSGLSLLRSQKKERPEMFLLKDYDYHLPEALIAQRPVTRRDHSKLLFLDQELAQALFKLMTMATVQQHIFVQLIVVH